MYHLVIRRLAKEFCCNYYSLNNLLLPISFEDRCGIVCAARPRSACYLFTILKLPKTASASIFRQFMPSL